MRLIGEPVTINVDFISYIFRFRCNNLFYCFSCLQFNESDQSDEDFRARVDSDMAKEVRTRLRSKLRRMGAKPPAKVRREKPVPVRKLFGENEEIYVMDAKITGNIGRYFNVSVI